MNAKKLGRPTKYKQEYNNKAYKLCLLGATDAQLADFFEVNEDTINEWKKVHTSFSESLKEGKDQADAVIAHSLFHRAKGYSHPEEKIFIRPNGGNKKVYEAVEELSVSLEVEKSTIIKVLEGKEECVEDVVRADTTKHYPPDTTACIFWLKNRQRKGWADTKQIENPEGKKFKLAYSLDE